MAGKSAPPEAKPVGTRTKVAGRAMGTPNLVTATAKENMIAVFTRLGGTAAMADWARENLTDFYKLYARLIPTQVTADIRVTEAIALTDEQLIHIATRGGAGTVKPQESPPEPSRLQ